MLTARGCDSIPCCPGFLVCISPGYSKMTSADISNFPFEVPAFWQEEITAELQEAINEHNTDVSSLLRYHMGWEDASGQPKLETTGKLLRPKLCLLACQATGGNIQQVLPAAAALEFIHNFSLIHDDIEDNSQERHHRATVWKLWGKAQAINAGDAMFSIAHIEVLKLQHAGISARKTLSAAGMLSKACLNLCEGQHMDISYEARSDVTTQDYLNMITKKTAALLATATALGAYLGAVEDKDGRITDRFYRFGEYLGLAFQIRDDILGIWGDERQTGKPVGADIKKKKKTLPVLYALEKSSVINSKEFKEIHSRKLLEGSEVTKIIGMLDKVNARKYTQEKVEYYSHQALAQLEATGIQAAKLAPLEEITHSLVGRDY